MTRERGISVELRICHGWIAAVWLVALLLLWRENDPRWGLFATGVAASATMAHCVSQMQAMLRFAYEAGRDEGLRVIHGSR